MLTARQRDLLRYIRDYMNEHNAVSPSYDEMMEAMDLKSKSGIYRLVKRLEERGFIEREEYKARAIKITKLPDEMRDRETSTAAFNNPSMPPSPAISNVADRQVPLYGLVAAGTPIDALRDPDDHITLPEDFIGRRECFALKIDGQSMVGAGIMDGDVVLIEPAETADNDDIVVALVDGDYATLKRLRREGQSIELHPDNPEHMVQRYGADQVQVQGKLIGLLRQYE
jgi:repressor LexA